MSQCTQCGGEIESGDVLCGSCVGAARTPEHAGEGSKQSNHRAGLFSKAAVAVVSLVLLVAFAISASAGDKTAEPAPETTAADPTVSRPQVSTFLVYAAMPTVGRAGEVTGTTEDGATGSFPYGDPLETLERDDILEYEKRVLGNGEVQIRYLRNTSLERREQKAAAEAAVSKERDEFYQDGDQILAELIWGDIDDLGDWAFAEEEAYLYVPPTEEGKQLWWSVCGERQSRTLDQELTAQGSVSGPYSTAAPAEHAKVAWIGKFRVIPGQLAAWAGDDIVFAVTYGAGEDSRFIPDPSRCVLVRRDGVWYLKSVVDEHPEYLDLTSAVINDVESKYVGPYSETLRSGTE